ncbi:hypothetical protein [Martelella soudanensis]|uniref:hypothetical protein n=1 Tax=unclassified Martelella TaxID=2629616 RepID=UPI0015DEC503|nr:MULTISPECIES: hypothetical protein [unclassified Martelella]
MIALTVAVSKPQLSKAMPAAADRNTCRSLEKQGIRTASRLFSPFPEYCSLICQTTFSQAKHHCSADRRVARIGHEASELVAYDTPSAPGVSG